MGRVKLSYTERYISAFSRIVWSMVGKQGITKETATSVCNSFREYWDRAFTYEELRGIEKEAAVWNKLGRQAKGRG